MYTSRTIADETRTLTSHHFGVTNVSTQPARRTAAHRAYLPLAFRFPIINDIYTSAHPNFCTPPQPLVSMDVRPPPRPAAMCAHFVLPEPRAHGTYATAKHMTMHINVQRTVHTIYGLLRSH